MDHEITIVEVATSEQRQQAQAIRVSVFVEEQGIPAELDFDGKDEAALHVVALSGDLPVATGRMFIESATTGEISRIAVLESHRGCGLGRRIVLQLEALARREGLDAVHLRPHHYLEKFYRDLGYERIGGATRAGGHRLIHMLKRLESTT